MITVVDTEGEPIKNAIVSLRAKELSAESSINIRTNEKGNASFEIPHGFYSITLHHALHQTKEKEITFSEDRKHYIVKL